MTGHNFLKKHQAIINKTDNNLCGFCEDGVSKESSEHIMSHCSKFATLRQILFNDPYPQPPYTNLSFEQVVNFLKMAKINTHELHSNIKEMLKAHHPDWLSQSDTEDN